MLVRRGFAWLVLVGAFSIGCSSDDKGGRAQATGGASSGGATASTGGNVTSGGAPASGGSGSPATGGSGPVITSAPPRWAPPADCGGVGEKCEFLSCNGAALCQAEGDVCIPRGGGANGVMLPGQSADHPYCLAYTCMTYEEASCFCTGEAAKQFTTCKDGPGAVAGICSGDGAACGTGSRPCCDGLSCSMTSPTSGTCRKTCTTGTDCDTGCCTDLKDNGQLVCAPAQACTTPCKKRGAACQPSAGDCCNGTCVDSTNPQTGGCRPTCKTNADCDTNCCELFQGQTYGFCADAQWCTGCKQDSECSTQCCIKPSDLDRAICVDSKFCACGQQDAPCGGDTGILRCCGDATCVSPAQANTFTCMKNCKLDADCPAGCCSAFAQGEDHGSCLPAQYCN